MPFEINYRGQRLRIERTPPTKRTKRLRLNVHQDTRITVSAPKRTSDIAIQRFIDQHVEWLYQQFNRVKANYQPPPQFCYQHGELHWFKGERYPLVLHDCNPTSAASPLALVVKNPQQADKVQAALWRFYQTQALAYFSARMDVLTSLTPWVNTIPQIKTRKMTRQWGNCAHAGHITLNTHLIKAPPICIDYVILHELCHLQEFNHSARFYALMDAVMPDWRVHKAHLSTLSSQLIAC